MQNLQTRNVLLHNRPLVHLATLNLLHRTVVHPMLTLPLLVVVPGIQQCRYHVMVTGFLNALFYAHKISAILFPAFRRIHKTVFKNKSKSTSYGMVLKLPFRACNETGNPLMWNSAC